MLKNMFVSRNIVKWVLFLILNFSLCTQSFADHYRVTAPNGLNVRASANKNGKLLGQLSKDNVIDVVSIENGWANINYNGWQGYVSASYLEAVTETDEAGTSTKEESWDLTFRRRIGLVHSDKVDTVFRHSHLHYQDCVTILRIDAGCRFDCWSDWIGSRFYS